MKALDDRASSGVEAVDGAERSPISQESVSTIPHRALRRILFIGLVGAATLTLQQWIGDATIYLPVNRAKAETLHESILRNEPPAGRTWDNMGANGTNVRVGAVLVAEGVHRVLGLSVPRTYLLLDTIFLFAGILLVARLLATWFREDYVLIGTMYLIIVLPLTYFLLSYHPWDRLALAFWGMMILALRANRILIFALLLPLSVVVKYDSVILPGLYFLANVTPATWRRTTLMTIGLFCLSFGAFFGLLVLRPGGFAQQDIGQRIAENFAHMREFSLWYPPLLAFGVPLVLAGVGFRHSDRFMRACAVFGVLLFIPLFLQSFFAEFRAQVPMFVLLLPCALRGAEVLLAPDSMARNAAAT